MTTVWPPPVGVMATSVAPQPFPVSVPFRIQPDLRRLSVESGAPAALLISDAQYADYARLKRAHLEDDARPLVAIASGVDDDRVLSALRAAMRVLGQQHPGLIGLAGGGCVEHFLIHRAGLSIAAQGSATVTALCDSARPLVARLAALTPAARCLAALALGIQEDLVLMGWPQRPGPGATGSIGKQAGVERAADWDVDGQGLVALALSVVLPSGWVPSEKLGRPLASIHHPVAQGGPLRDASLNLSRAMVDKGPFERFVWTLAPDGALARWPGAVAATEGAARSENRAELPIAAVPGRLPLHRWAHGSPPGAVDHLRDVYFRTERQVTLGLPAFGAALFLIRVQVRPLIEAAGDASRRAQLVAALRSMSDEVVAYKNIGPLRERVVRAWGEAPEKGRVGP